MLRDQFGVTVVDHARDFRLMLRIGKENVRRRERDYFDVDANAIHIFETFGNVSHWRRYAKKSRAPIRNDRLAGWAPAEGELRRNFANLVEIRRGLEMGVA